MNIIIPLEISESVANIDDFIDSIKSKTGQEYIALEIDFIEDDLTSKRIAITTQPTLQKLDFIGTELQYMKAMYSNRPDFIYYEKDFKSQNEILLPKMQENNNLVVLKGKHYNYMKFITHFFQREEIVDIDADIVKDYNFIKQTFEKKFVKPIKDIIDLRGCPYREYIYSGDIKITINNCNIVTNEKLIIRHKSTMFVFDNRTLKVYIIDIGKKEQV